MVSIKMNMKRNDSAEFSHGLKLPVEENHDDPVFKKYQEFKEVTTTDLMERLHKLVKGKE